MSVVMDVVRHSIKEDLVAVAARHGYDCVIQSACAFLSRDVGGRAEHRIINVSAADIIELDVAEWVEHRLRARSIREEPCTIRTRVDVFERVVAAGGRR